MECRACRPWVCFLVLAALPSGAVADDALAGKAREVLKTHCARCHGREAKAKGGFDYVLERDLLVARNKLVPGKAAESEIFQRVRDGEMPPRQQKERPSKDKVSALEAWINGGAPSDESAKPQRAVVSDSDILRSIRADLEALPAPQRRFARYFTLANLANASRSEDELVACRLALAKLVNSLSRHPRLSIPVAIDATHTVYRIDLRAYKWSDRTWEHLVAAYPYRIDYPGPDAKVGSDLSGTELPLLRADWFIATASRPPLYYDLLQMPVNDRALESLLQVDVAADIEEGSVARAGFNGSGVSKNNRLIERHDAGHGAYWKTYDFADNTDRQNLFEHPLGPPPARSAFVQAGGELIFHLPNGLLGYMLVDRNGRAIERAPVDIVSDPQRPDRAVEAGLSCMTCHARGLIPKGDQVRAHVLKNAQAFGREDVETVKSLYPPEARLKALVDQDNERYLAALGKLGIQADAPEPTSAVTLRYEGVIDLAGAAGEAGLAPADFAERLGKSAEWSRALRALRAQGGTVQRQVFQTAFPDLVKEFHLGESLATSKATDTGPAFAGHTDTVQALAFSLDSKRAVTGGADRTVRVWDVASGKEVMCLKGHTGEVTAVAFSSDGRRLLSGSADRTVRLWDLTTGKEIHTLTGHVDGITCLAFSPDGGRALSGGQDHSLRLWDLEKGEEVLCFELLPCSINSVAFALDGKCAATACGDRTVRLWDVRNGKEVGRFEGHTDVVHSAAFSPDGKRVVSGGNDRTVRIWDVASGQQVRCLEGHANAVIRVAFDKEGKRILSASSQYRQADRTLRTWDAATGQEVRRGPGSPTGQVRSVAFSPDGQLALIGGANPLLRLWKLGE